MGKYVLSGKRAASLEDSQRAVARCPRCGEIAGEGEKCVECAKVRIARNTPRAAETAAAACRLPAAACAYDSHARAAPPADTCKRSSHV